MSEVTVLLILGRVPFSSSDHDKSYLRLSYFTSDFCSMFSLNLSREKGRTERSRSRRRDARDGQLGLQSGCGRVDIAVVATVGVLGGPSRESTGPGRRLDESGTGRVRPLTV